MKRSVFMIFLIVLALCMAGCGTQNTPAGNTPAESSANNNAAEQSTPENTAEPEIVLSEDGVFDHLFVMLADKVAKMTYDECVALLESESYQFEKTAPSDTVMGKIEVPDDNGFTLHISFYPDSRNKQTITLVAYNNGMYEASADDSGHISSVSYGTFDSTRTTVNAKVKSVDDLIRFIKVDVPKSMEKYAEANKEKEMIEVSLEVTAEASGGKVYFTIKTNLPDDTELMLTLTHKGGMAQDKVTVYGGTAKSGGFTNRGSQITGECTLSISTPYPNLEPRSVQEIIGANGEYMTGPYIVKDSLSGQQNMVDAEFKFTL